MTEEPSVSFGVRREAPVCAFRVSLLLTQT